MDKISVNFGISPEENELSKDLLTLSEAQMKEKYGPLGDNFQLNIPLTNSLEACFTIVPAPGWPPKVEVSFTEAGKPLSPFYQYICRDELVGDYKFRIGRHEIDLRMEEDEKLRRIGNYFIYRPVGEDARYCLHDGELCKILRGLSPQETDILVSGLMWEAEFPNGDVLHIFDRELREPGHEMERQKESLNEQIRVADSKASAQTADKTPIFLFEENRSGERMGKPGDANNVYFAEWFEFFAFGPDCNPCSAGVALNFKVPDTHKPVPGGNGVSEVDVIEAFRKANPGRSVVMLGLDPFKGDLEVKMNQAVKKFKEDGIALMKLPPIDAARKKSEVAR